MMIIFSYKSESRSKLNEKLSVTSVSALDISWDNTKFIGPNGDNQFKAKPVVDLILLLSSIESS